MKGLLIVRMNEESAGARLVNFHGESGRPNTCSERKDERVADVSMSRLKAHVLEVKDN